MRDKIFKCTICGKFVSYSDIQNGDVIQEFTPDTHRSIEKMEMTHKKCIIKI